MMAQVKVKQRTKINLAVKMDEGEVQTLEDIKSILASHDVDINAHDTLGWTPLMNACADADKSMVEFLLEHGADPNAKCTEDGNTAMHYASLDTRCQCFKTGDICDFYDYSKKRETQIRLDIIQLLISHGATSMCNSMGLDPPSLAALHRLSDIVNFFVQMNTSSSLLSDEEKARACEILGVALALEPKYEWYNCSADVAPYAYFCKALDIREASGTPSAANYEKSELASSFFLFTTEECKTRTDWEKIRMDTWAIKTQSFLLADRVLPEEMKNRYIRRNLLSHAYHGVFCSWRSQERLSQGFLIFRDALQLELQSKLEPGTVLSELFWGFMRESLSDDCPLTEYFELMDDCLKVFSEVSEPSLSEVSRVMMQELGYFVCNSALSVGCRSKETFEMMLHFIKKMICLFRRRCQRWILSITHVIIRKIEEKFWPLAPFEDDRRVMNLRVKRLISRIVQCEDASQISYTYKGNTMLHSLLELECTSSTDVKFIRDVALILIRNGCDIEAQNFEGETTREAIRVSNPNPEHKELLALLIPPTTALPLEELAARVILRHKIPHQGVLPKHLSSIVTGEFEPDTELFRPVTPRESSSDSTSSSDASDSDSEVLKILKIIFGSIRSSDSE